MSLKLQNYLTRPCKESSLTMHSEECQIMSPSLTFCDTKSTLGDIYWSFLSTSIKHNTSGILHAWARVYVVFIVRLKQRVAAAH